MWRRGEQIPRYRPSGAVAFSSHARQRIELRAAGAGGEARGAERDVALQHQGKMLFHVGRGRADGDRARDIRGAVGILAARIDEIELAGSELAVGLGARAIMDDGAVGSRAGDRAEREIAQQIGRASCRERVSSVV